MKKFIAKRVHRIKVIGIIMFLSFMGMFIAGGINWIFNNTIGYTPMLVENLSGFLLPMPLFLILTLGYIVLRKIRSTR